MLTANAMMNNPYRLRFTKILVCTGAEDVPPLAVERGLVITRTARPRYHEQVSGCIAVIMCLAVLCQLPGQGTDAAASIAHYDLCNSTESSSAPSSLSFVRSDRSALLAVYLNDTAADGTDTAVVVATSCTLNMSIRFVLPGGGTNATSPSSTSPFPPRSPPGGGDAAPMRMFITFINVTVVGNVTFVGGPGVMIVAHLSFTLIGCDVAGDRSTVEVMNLGVQHSSFIITESKIATRTRALFFSAADDPLMTMYPSAAHAMFENVSVTVARTAVLLNTTDTASPTAGNVAAVGILTFICLPNTVPLCARNVHVVVSDSVINVTSLPTFAGWVTTASFLGNAAHSNVIVIGSRMMTQVAQRSTILSFRDSDFLSVIVLSSSFTFGVATGPFNMFQFLGPTNRTIITTLNMSIWSGVPGLSTTDQGYRVMFLFAGGCTTLR